MVSALKPGGVLLSVEPDMLPCTVAEPDSMHRFWEGWLMWSVEAGIDYFVGGKILAWLDSLGLADIAGEGHTAQFNGGRDGGKKGGKGVRGVVCFRLQDRYFSE